jgi:predicted SAM-dependent methyltransferase
MANITFSLPDDKIDAIVDAFSTQEGYQDMIWENDALVPNPETRIQFTRKVLRQIMKNAYVNHQALLAANAAKVIAEGEV